MPGITVAFFYQDEWEAQRFKDNVPPDVTVVALPRGRALDAGQIAGAWLDVTEIEPIEANNLLLGRDNVVLLPHRAGTSIEAREKSIDTAVLNATLLTEGKDPVRVVLPV